MKILIKVLIISMVISVISSFAIYGDDSKSYSDIENHWAKSIIEKWSEYNLINGYADGNFKPNNNITRAEVVKVVNSIIGAKVATGDGFDDVAPDEWFYTDMLKAKTEGYYKGYSNNISNAKLHITRQDAVVLLSRTIVLDSVKIVGAPVEVSFTDLDQISEYAKDTLLEFYKMGVVKGYNDGTIKPKSYITRAELVSMIDKIMEFNSKSPEEYKIFLENITGESSKNDSVNWKNKSFVDSQNDLIYPEVFGHPDKTVQNKINKKIIEVIDTAKGYTTDEYKVSSFNAYEVTYNKNKLFSVLFTNSLYTEEAAHPGHEMKALVFNLDSGDLLTLDDFFKAGYDYSSIMKDVGTKYVSGLDFELFRDYAGVEDKKAYYLKKDGFTLFYQEYDYTAYGFGPLRIPIGYTKFKNLLYNL